MPGFVKTPRDEARWEKAKEAAGKQTDKGSESYWKLSNYIYHKMGKTEEDQALQKSDEHGHSAVPHHEFHNALHAASAVNPKIKENVEFHPPEKLQHMKTFLSADKHSGYAIKPDGELTAVFSGKKGRGDAILRHATSQGAKHLNAFEGHLTNLYGKHGFKEHRREKNWTPGGPDIVHMKRSENMGKSEESYMLANSLELTIDNLRDFLVNGMDQKQSSLSNGVEKMSEEKKYSAKEAAIAVLKKAEEMLKKTELLKTDPLSSTAGDRMKRGAGYKERGDQANYKIAIEGAKESHKERLADVKASPKPNLTKDEYKTGAEHAATGKARQSEKAARETGASKRTGDLSNNGKPNLTKDEVAGKPYKLNTIKHKGHDISIRSSGNEHVAHITSGAKAGHQTKPHSSVADAANAAIEQIEKSEELIKAEMGHARVSSEWSESKAKPKESRPVGVHTPSYSSGKDHGQSEAGDVTRQAASGKHGSKFSSSLKSAAVGEHKKVLSDLKAMPKPNLTKDEPVGEIHPKEHVEGEPEKPGDRIESQAAPDKNAKEQAEGNNELAGTTPNQVGQDGKNIVGFDEMRGHIKLAKFIGHMQAKRKLSAPVAAEIDKAETGHESGVHTAIKAPHLGGGTSKAGLEAKVGKELGSHPAGKESISESKKMHTGKLAQLQAMPNPKLPK